PGALLRKVAHLAAGRLANTHRARPDARDPAHAGARAAAAATSPDWPGHTPASPGPSGAPPRARSASAAPPRLAQAHCFAGGPAGEPLAVAPGAPGHNPWTGP